MKTIAIMQPTYLPWIGYFGLIDIVDDFVILDSVQFEKHSWQQRNRIKTTNGVQWLTVPAISKGRRHQLIKDVQIDPGRKFVEKHTLSIVQNYSKAPYFDDYAPNLLSIIAKSHSLLSALTIELIKWARDQLGIVTPLTLASELNCTGTKDQLLVNICKKTNAQIYISPIGSKQYLENSTPFQSQKKEIRYFNFCHPAYAQLHGEFIPFLSVIDLMFNAGGEGIQIIRRGVG